MMYESVQVDDWYSLVIEPKNQVHGHVEYHDHEMA